MKNDLTIAKIKHTDFAELYDKFIIGKKLNQKQYETLLAIAICFTNADDINVQQRVGRYPSSNRGYRKEYRRSL